MGSFTGGACVTLEFQFNFKSLYNVILVFLIDTKLGPNCSG